MKSINLFLSIAAGVILAGCGGGERSTDAAATKQTPTAEDAKAAVPPAAVTTAAGGAAGVTTPATPAATASARVVALTGDDAMRYNINEITAAPGEALRIELKNIGRMPKQTMSHNWVLLKPIADADVQKLAMDAATKAPNYLPADQSAIIAHTKMLGPGESDAIEIKAPSEPGEYPYICTFPGHFALMRGKLIVK